MGVHKKRKQAGGPITPLPLNIQPEELNPQVRLPKEQGIRDIFIGNTPLQEFVQSGRDTSKVPGLKKSLKDFEKFHGSPYRDIFPTTFGRFQDGGEVFNEDVGMGFAQGAATGALTGSAFGGIGALPGAVIGGLAGGLGGFAKNKKKVASLAEQQQAQALANQQLFEQNEQGFTGSQFAPPQTMVARQGGQVPIFAGDKRLGTAPKGMNIAAIGDPLIDSLQLQGKSFEDGGGVTDSTLTPNVFLPDPGFQFLEPEFLSPGVFGNIDTKAQADSTINSLGIQRFQDSDDFKRFHPSGKVQINAEGSNGKKTGELEVKAGKVVKDLRGLPEHPKNGNIDLFGNVLATPGNTIIPKDQRKDYLEGDKITRRTIEAQLRKDQRGRDEEELDMFRGGGKLKHGGAVGTPHKYVRGGNIFDDPALEFGQPVEGQTGGFFTGSPTGTVSPPLDSFRTQPPAGGLVDTGGGGGGKKFNFNQASQFAPLLFNLGAGLFGETPEADPIFNPRREQALKLLSERQVDFDPVLRDIELGEATAAKQLRNVTGGQQGQFLPSRIALAAATQRSAANARLQADMINQGFRGDEARALTGIGSEEAAAQERARGLNLSFQANRAQFLPKAAEQAASIGARNQFRGQQQETNQLLRARLEEMRATAVAAGDQALADSLTAQLK